MSEHEFEGKTCMNATLKHFESKINIDIETETEKYEIGILRNQPFKQLSIFQLKFNDTHLSVIYANKSHMLCM